MRRALFLAMFGALTVGVLALACGDHPEPSADRPAPSRLVGNRCGGDTDCDVWCAGGRDFPGGFCTVKCYYPEDCPEGTVCVGDSLDDSACVYPCADTLDCRIAGPGYACKRRRDPTGQFQYNACLGE